MALLTAGTVASTSLDALLFSRVMNATDFAALQQKIKNDLNVAHPVWPDAFTRDGKLYVPNRGVLTVLPGDYVCVDATGWPVLVSANAMADATDWTHS